MKYSFFSLCIIAVIFGPNRLSAQHPQKADQLYEDFGYKTSIPLLEANIDKEGMTEEDVWKIANSYRLVHDTENAEKWYGELVQLSEQPIHYLHYAQALQSNGHTAQARKYFLLYDQLMGTNDNRGKLLGEAIDRMNQFKKTDIQIKNEAVVNTEKIDFSPAFFKDGIVFVSTRSSRSSANKKDIWVDDNFTTLFYAQLNTEGELRAPAEFSEKISSAYHEGPLSANRKGDQVFFTRSNYLDGKRGKSKDKIVRLNIYTAHEEKDDWGSVQKLPFCTDEFDEMHPSLTGDGESLYFSSNRAGGFGGMDLYVTYFRAGEWSEPINLGENINTSGNESFPFIHDDGTLYFSSDGWGGLGAMDIFSATRVEDRYWSEPVNIGTPFNSPKDDFGFILNVLGTEGYLSSARDGGKGLDDIYSFKLQPEVMKKPKVVRLSAVLCTYDEKTNERLPDVNVSVIEGTRDESGFRMSEIYTLVPVPSTDGTEFFQVLLKKSSNDTISGYVDLTQVTDDKGEILYELRPDKEYVFLAKKDGYRLGQKVFTTEGMELPADLSFCVPLTKKEGISIKGVVTNATQGNRIAGAKVTLFNHTTNEELPVRSNLLGEFSFPNLECHCDYSLTAGKEGFANTTKKIDLASRPCPEGESLHYVLQLLSLNEQDPSLVSSDPTTRIKVGTVIELENIYYDFDKYHIRPDAAKSLDQLAALLRQYPSMNIELSAHTDSRGSWQYNRRLSKNRARSARKYLLSKGIAAHRLKATGWGESKLRNHCDDGVPCAEAEHQYNRRTEFAVTKFDRTDIKILYLNNLPEVIHSYKPGRSNRR